MWKRDEPVRPQPNVASTSSVSSADASSPASSQSVGAASRTLGREVVNIGKSVIIKGELSGSEDLTIEGKVDGQIALRDHVLTIGPNGRIMAKVFARSVIVMGHVTGDIVASDKVNIRENGNVQGDIAAPTIAIAEGAQFRGSIDMKKRPPASKAAQPSTAQADSKPRAEAKSPSRPAVAPTQVSAPRAAH